jgi:NADPH-dependent ferric siderophore reductase
VLEFALHGSGPFSTWAGQAAPGQTRTVAGPRGSMVIPTDYAWHWLVGDDTAWPAIARRLEELPAESRVSPWLLMDDAPTLPAQPERLSVRRACHRTPIATARRSRRG